MLELDTNKTLTLDINSNHNMSLDLTGNRNVALNLSVPRSIIKNTIKTNTTEYWNSDPSFVPNKGEIIVYTDYTTKVNDEGETINIPAIKIGDGSTYCVDLPFVSDDIRDMLMVHVNNRNIHVSELEKLFWNNKLNVNDSQEVVEDILIFNRN